MHWSEPVEIMRERDAHDQVYSMPVFRYGDIFLGLPAQFHKGDLAAPDWDTVTTELAWSSDTIHWQRICPGEALIPLGQGEYPDGAYDCGCIYAAAPLVQGENILIYYGGSNGLHNGWREGSFNLATLQRDRFAGYAPTSIGEIGVIETTPMIAQQGSLAVNVDIDSGGWLRAAVLDRHGSPIAGYGFIDCSPLQSGGQIAVVRWKDNEFSSLAGRKVRIVFEIAAAKLYAFSGCVGVVVEEEGF